MSTVSQKARNKALEKGRSLVITLLSDSVPEKLRHDALHGIVQAIVELSPICVARMCLETASDLHVNGGLNSEESAVFSALVKAWNKHMEAKETKPQMTA